MIKDCPVKLNNECVTVVSFGDINIQFPSIHRDAKIVRVLYEDGKYSIVSDNYEEPAPLKSERVKKRIKKTTIETRENVETVESAEEIKENDSESDCE